MDWNHVPFFGFFFILKDVPWEILEEKQLLSSSKNSFFVWPDAHQWSFFPSWEEEALLILASKSPCASFVRFALQSVKNLAWKTYSLLTKHMEKNTLLSKHDMMSLNLKISLVFSIKKTSKQMVWITSKWFDRHPHFSPPWELRVWMGNSHPKQDSPIKTLTLSRKGGVDQGQGEQVALEGGATPALLS